MAVAVIAWPARTAPGCAFMSRDCILSRFCRQFGNERRVETCKVGQFCGRGVCGRKVVFDLYCTVLGIIERKCSAKVGIWAASRELSVELCGTEL